MKPIYTYLLLAAAIIVAAICAYNWYSSKKELNDYRASFDTHSTIVTDSNKEVLDSIKKENAVLANSVLKYKARADSLEDIQAKIITDTKTVRDEIHITPDSGQLAILYRLLAEHRATPVARD